MSHIDLLSELSQGTEPHDVMARECLVARLRMLNREVTGFYDDALRPLEVKVSQTNVLTAIAKLQPVSPGVIAEVLRIEKSTLSRNLERLRSRGWLRILPGDDDRSHRLETTAKGKRLLEDALPLWKQGQKKARKLLGKQTAKALNDTADRMWSRLQADD
jgi:DNA-binding MarR family transcriptional regulator